MCGDRVASTMVACSSGDSRRSPSLESASCTIHGLSRYRACSEYLCALNAIASASSAVSDTSRTDESPDDQEIWEIANLPASASFLNRGEGGARACAVSFHSALGEMQQKGLRCRHPTLSAVLPNYYHLPE